MNTLLDRFYYKWYIDKNDCWNWLGALNCDGYGVINKRKRETMRVHRLSWMLFNGPIPDGLCVCHKCDNPSCVNPKHLFLGTPADNMKDKHRKGRSANQIGEENNNAKLTRHQVEFIKDLVSEGLSKTFVAKMFGVRTAAISKIIKGQRWRIHYE